MRDPDDPNRAWVFFDWEIADYEEFLADRGTRGLADDYAEVLARLNADIHQRLYPMPKRPSPKEAVGEGGQRQPHGNAAAPFDPRKRRSPRPTVGGPPPRTPVDAPIITHPPAEVGSVSPSVALSAVPAVGEGSGDDTRLPGRQRRPGSREIHVHPLRTGLPAPRNRPRRTARHQLRRPRPLRPRQCQTHPPRKQAGAARGPAAAPRAHPATPRRRPHPVTAVQVAPAQADAIRALADDAGIPNLSELVDRAVVLTYDETDPG